jgi:DnaJ-domain-containing protein 1
VKLVFLAVLLFLIYQMISKSGSKVLEGALPKPKGSPKPAGGRPAHEVLGVEPDASPAEIKRAYQQKIQQYHPDRVANAAPELQELAEKRSKELNAAYAQLSGD